MVDQQPHGRPGGASHDASDKSRDPAARDGDPASDLGPSASEFTRDVGRGEVSGPLEQGTGERMGAAGERDAAGDARDMAAVSRDRVSDERGLAMTRRDAADEHEGARPITGGQVVMLAAERRRRAARDRAHGAHHRSLADEDRRAAALDRQYAADDRRRASADRDAFVRLLAITETDPLTGARTRRAGLGDLERELERCRRTTRLLIVAFVDVVGLKAVNDSHGHDAGDRLLTRVVAVIGQHLRPYDLIVRLGGDEFLCVISNVSSADARERFSAIARSLAGAPVPAAIRCGFASLTGDESAANLIARADGELTRGSRGT
jgi:diguanylate cyclase (GGDEF)-like protein